MTEKKGRLTVVAGPMFSGKTSVLRQSAERSEIAGIEVQVFKPSIDERGEGAEVIASRDGTSFRACPISDPLTILTEIGERTGHILIDEAQFMGQQQDGRYIVIDVVDEILKRGIDVTVAGLPTDFRGESFGPMPDLLVRADKRIDQTAICTHADGETICGRDATMTQRFVGGEPADWRDPVVLVGDIEEGYTARCRDHHVVLNKPDFLSPEVR